MPSFSASLVVVAGSALLVASWPLWAQLALSDEFQVNENIRLTQDSQKIAVTSDGSFAIGWTDGRGETIPYTPIAVAKFYDRLGSVVREEFDLVSTQSATAGLVVNPLGGYQVFWFQAAGESSDIVMQGFNQDGTSRDSPTRVPGLDRNGVAFFTPAVTLAGRFVVFGIAPRYDLGAFGAEVKIARLGRVGQLLGTISSVALDPEAPIYGGDVGVDHAGIAVVAWAGECESEDVERCDIFAVRLPPGGQVPGPMRVNTKLVGLQESAQLAVAPDGRFLVTWVSGFLFPQLDPVDLFGQFFSPSGRRIGREFRVNTITEGFQWQQDVAADPMGNYLVVWASFRRENGIYGWDILGQLYHREGRPVGKEFRINQRNTFNETAQPQVAFGGNGTFVVTWNADDGDFDGVFARRFAAAPGDELCVVSGDEMRCRFGRGGGEADVTLPRPGGELVFGDVDRDGQDDACVFTAGLWECDTDRRGFPFEVSFRFGKPGDLPLFGDVNGDGRDEPCVRRGRFHLCDTGHNGGRPEAGFGVGRPEDRPLLGDVDGDGRDDACVFALPSRFRCDLKHNGKEDWARDFGQEDDHALLADFDGDGDADPCVFRFGHLLCDTAHNGGEAEAELDFGWSGNLMAANLDGL